MIFSIILFTIVALIVYILANFTGALLVGFVLPNKMNSKEAGYLFSHFFGLLSILLLYSVVVTLGKTVSIIMLIPLLAMFINKNKRGSIVNWKSIISIPHLLVFGGVFVTTSLLSHVLDYSVSINNDMLFYANIGKNIGYDGGENIYHYFNGIIPNNYTNGTYPYHYFEFWFLSFLRPLFTEFSAIIVLKYLVYVYFKSYIILGIVAILKELKVALQAFYLYPAIILVAIIPFEDFLNLFDVGWSYHLSVWTRPNFLTYLFVLIPFVLLIIKKEFYSSTLILLLLPSITTVTAPVVFIFVSLMIFTLMLSKNITKKEFWQLSVVIFITALGVMMFYKYTGVKIESLTLTKEYIIEQYRITWKAMVYLTSVMILTIATTLLLPWFIAKYMGDNKKSFQFLIISSLVMVAIGIVVFQLGNFIDNFYQFPYLGYSFVYLLFVILLSWSLFSKKWIKYGAIGVVLLGGIFSISNMSLPISINIVKNNLINQNQGQILDIGELLENSSLIKGNGLMVLDSEVIDEIPPKKRDLLSNQYGNYLYYLNNTIALYPFVSDSIFYKASAADVDFSKAHIFNDILPKELFRGNKIELNQVIEDYEISFLLITGKENVITYTKLFLSSKVITISEDKILLILNV